MFYPLIAIYLVGNTFDKISFSLRPLFAIGGGGGGGGGRNAPAFFIVFFLFFFCMGVIISKINHFEAGPNFTTL